MYNFRGSKGETDSNFYSTHVDEPICARQRPGFQTFDWSKMPSSRDRMSASYCCSSFLGQRWLLLRKLFYFDMRVIGAPVKANWAFFLVITMQYSKMCNTIQAATMTVVILGICSSCVSTVIGPRYVARKLKSVQQSGVLATVATRGSQFEVAIDGPVSGIEWPLFRGNNRKQLSANLPGEASSTPEEPPCPPMV